MQRGLLVVGILSLLPVRDARGLRGPSQGLCCSQGTNTLGDTEQVATVPKIFPSVIPNQGNKDLSHKREENQ